MDPGQLQGRQDQFRCDLGDGAYNAWAGSPEGQDTDEDGAAKAPDDEKSKATERGPATSTSMEMADGGAQLGRDGLGLDDKDISIRIIDGFVDDVHLVVVRLNREIELGLGVLNNGKGGNDHSIGVLDLAEAASVWQ